MTAGDVDELSKTLGAIEARLTSIERNQIIESDRTRERGEALNITVAAQAQATMTLTGKVEKITDTIAEMKALTDDYRETRAQARGAAKVVMLFRALILFLVAVVTGILGYLGTRH